MVLRSNVLRFVEVDIGVEYARVLRVRPGSDCSRHAQLRSQVACFSSARVARDIVVSQILKQTISPDCMRGVYIFKYFKTQAINEWRFVASCRKIEGTSRGVRSRSSLLALSRSRRERRAGHRVESTTVDLSQGAGSTNQYPRERRLTSIYTLIVLIQKRQRRVLDVWLKSTK